MTKHDDSGNAYINMQITNQKQFMLPMTGGAGNYLLIIAGVVVAGCGILILNKNRRRSQR
jgi:LPXTG-motif cell wall-anchored protein